MSRWLHRYIRLVLAATLCLIAAGGLVTSTESGLSVPDWPLSYGRIFPPMIGGIRFEHSHRVIAGFVGLLTLAMTLFILKAEKRPWVRGVGAAALLAVFLQALLGGLTVIYLLPTAVSVAHACLGQTFFAILASLALFTSKEWVESKPEMSAEAVSAQRLAFITTVFVYLQLVAGAVVRHTAGKAGLPWHFTLAFLIFLHSLLTVNKIQHDNELHTRLSGHALLLGFLVIIQVFLGFGAYAFTQMLKPGDLPRVADIFFATAHQTTGALILAVSLTLFLRSVRLFKKKAGTTATAEVAAG